MDKGIEAILLLQAIEARRPSRQLISRNRIVQARVGFGEEITNVLEATRAPNVSES
jgi:hypothetical protein